MVNEMLRVWAPGRVNLIGGHTDYSGGLVLPMAIDLGTTIIGQRGHDRVVLVSHDEPEPAEVALDVTDPADVTPAWARYVAGVVAEVAPTTVFIGEVWTTIPIGTGLSSSAALEVAVALALVGDDRVDRTQLALACQRAEHRASGVPCGIMDQFSSLLGEEATPFSSTARHKRSHRSRFLTTSRSSSSTAESDDRCRRPATPTGARTSGEPPSCSPACERVAGASRRSMTKCCASAPGTS